MRKILNTKGLSLTELLVASIMIGIVMLGVVSFNYTVGSIETNTNKTTTIKNRTAAVMLQIKKDVLKAAGDITNMGIVTTDIPGNQFNSLCVRHDVSDPASYTDDQWICYYHDNTFVLNRSVFSPGTTPSGLPCTTAAECGSGLAGATVKEALQLISTDQAGAALGNFIFAESHDNCVDLTLTHRYDGNQAFDPISNPEYSLNTSVCATAHSL